MDSAVRHIASRHGRSESVALPSMAMIVVTLLSMCCTTLSPLPRGVYGATPATRIIANGVPVEIIFVSDENELLAANPELDTDDFNQPIPSMKGAQCSSLDGPYCLSMVYDPDVDLFGENDIEFDLSSEELMKLIRENIGSIDIDGLDLDLDFGLGSGGDDDDLGEYMSNDEILGAGMLEFFTGYSKIYVRKLMPGKPSPISEEYAGDMTSYANDVGLDEEFVPQFELFWANIEDDEYEYQVYVLDSQGLSGSEVIDQLSTYLDGSRKPEDVSFKVFTFIIDFDGVKRLDLDTYPDLVRLLYVQPHGFLSELLESLEANPPNDFEDGEEEEEEYDLLAVFDVDDAAGDFHNDELPLDHEQVSSSSSSSSGRRRTSNTQTHADTSSSSSSSSTSSSSSSSSSSLSDSHDGHPIESKKG